MLVSWLLAGSHLGMLENHRSLGVPNTVTLLRANLPATGGPVRWHPAAALASDLVDGRLARRMGSETAFGAYADSLADAVFWTWFVLRRVSRGGRVLCLICERVCHIGRGDAPRRGARCQQPRE